MASTVLTEEERTLNALSAIGCQHRLVFVDEPARGYYYVCRDCGKRINAIQRHYPNPEKATN